MEAREETARIVDLRLHNSAGPNPLIEAILDDGRHVSVPATWFPWFMAATLAQRSNIEIRYDYVYWTELNGTIEVADLFFPPKPTEVETVVSEEESSDHAEHMNGAAVPTEDVLVDLTHENIVLFCAKNAYEMVRGFSALFQGVYDIQPWHHIRPEDREAIMHGVELWIDSDKTVCDDAYTQWALNVFKERGRARTFEFAVEAAWNSVTNVSRVVGADAAEEEILP